MTGDLDSTRGRWRDETYGRAAVALIVLIALVRLVYLAWLSPWNLVEDEAQYWLWSQRLDWSYYSKGPGIAYIIAFGTAILGDSELGVRCMAPVMSALTSWLAYLLTRAVSGSRRIALYAVLCLQLAPILGALGVLMTIDGPYVALWTVACWCGWQAIERRRWWAWTALGLAVGAAFLTKYTALLLLPGLLLYALLFGNVRQLLRRPATYLVVPALILACLPVVIWNAQHDWVTVRHLLGHAHVGGHDDAVRWSPKFVLLFVGTQLGAIGITLWPLVICAIIWVFRRGQWNGTRAQLSDHQVRGAWFLVCCGGPVLGFYAIASLFIEVEGNWPLAGYATLLMLVGWGVAELAARGGWWRLAWHWTIAYGVVGGLLALYPNAVNAPAAVLRVAGVDAPFVYPHRRLIGARDFAAATEAVDRAYGGELAPIAGHYGRASTLGFYLPDRPVVRSASARMQGRQAQHDFWPSHSFDDPSLAGTNAILVGEPIRKWRREEAFDELIRCPPCAIERNGDTVTEWELSVGIGYRGFPQRARSTF